MRRILVVAVVLVLGGCAKPPPEVELLIPINGRCTTCVDFVRCDGGSGNPAIYDPTFDLYHLKPKGTLAQIATIWNYLIQIFRPLSGDQRPLTVHVQRPGQTQAFERNTQAEQVAVIDLVRHRLGVPDGWVDQVNGDWHAADDVIRGHCKLLTRMEGEALLALFVQSAASSGPPAAGP